MGSGRPVRATVYGPEIGFRCTRTNYFRWVQSTKAAERWGQRQPDRKQDQIHVAKCNQIGAELVRTAGGYERVNVARQSLIVFGFRDSALVVQSAGRGQHRMRGNRKSRRIWD